MKKIRIKRERPHLTADSPHEEIMRWYEKAKERKRKEDEVYEMIKSSLNRRKEKLEAQMRDKEKNT